MNGLRYVPMINGVVHSWSTLAVAITGIPVTGIKKISYKDSQTIENVYGAGQKPIGRGYGRIVITIQNSVGSSSSFCFKIISTSANVMWQLAGP